MTDLIDRTLNRLAQQLCGRLSIPGDERFAAATAIWAKPAGQKPRAVAHCRTPQDVQSAIRSAREAGISLSVRGGGHDWACRALCDGIVIDLSGMNGVIVDSDRLTAKISGGSRAADVLAATSARPRRRDGLVQRRWYRRTYSRWRLWAADRPFRACVR